MIPFCCTLSDPESAAVSGYICHLCQCTQWVTWQVQVSESHSRLPSAPLVPLDSSVEESRQCSSEAAASGPQSSATLLTYYQDLRFLRFTLLTCLLQVVAAVQGEDEAGCCGQRLAVVSPLAIVTFACNPASASFVSELRLNLSGASPQKANSPQSEPMSRARRSLGPSLPCLGAPHCAVATARRTAYSQPPLIPPPPSL